MEQEEKQDIRANPDELISKNYDPGSEQPTVEELFIREAVKHLTSKQKQVWEYHNFDKLTQQEIGNKLGISQQAVMGHLRAINERIKKWCDYHQEVYDIIKDQLNVNKD